jgi:hypothetical protein
VLWRVAARGHYLVHRKPVRDTGRRPFTSLYQPAIPPLGSESGYTLSFARGEANELSLLLNFPESRMCVYPLRPYPAIAEFRAMLAALQPGVQPQPRWDGEHFFIYANERNREIGFWLRAQSNGIAIGFSGEEWSAIRELFRRAWEVPEVRIAWDALGLKYGEL